MADQIAGLVPVSKQEVTILLEAGYQLMNMKRFDPAREVFSGVAALLPRSDVPHLALGTLEFALGRHAKALQEYRRAQQLAPESGLSRAHVGEALLFLGKASEAIKELNAALEIEPDGDGARLARALLDAHQRGALPYPSDEK